MSTEQTFDPNLVEQTRLQIRAMVNEITQLSKMDIPPEEFHAEVLPKIVTALAAIGGALWTVDDRGALSLGFQVNMQELRLAESEDANKKHSRLLYKMLQNKEDGTLVMPRSGGDGNDEAGNPTDFLLVFAPIRTELEQVGLLEIAQRADTGPVAQKGYIKFLGQMGAVCADFYKNRQLRNFSERQTLWTLLEEFTRTIHKTLDLRETAYTVVNEGRRLVECDRVSIAISKGGKCRIESVSGQDMVDKRSTTVKLLGKLATAVVKSDEPIWYTGDTTDFAPQVEKAVEDYVDESHTKMIAVFPLKKKKLEETPEEDIKAREKPEPPFGAIIIEQIEDSRVPERMKKRVEIVSDHACSALGNSLDHNSVFLMPLWRRIGKSKVLVSARMLPKTITVSACIVFAILFMIFVPWNFSPSADGTLLPVHRSNVYANLDGTVREVFVGHEDFVEAGDLLLATENMDLDQRELEYHGEILRLNEELDSANRKRISPQTPPEDIVDITGQIRRLVKQLETQRELLEILLDQKDELMIRAPISGNVLLLDPKKDLSERPVMRGQILMEIADTDLSKPWRVEVDMPEKRMGHIIDYQRKIREKDPGAQLDVEFVPASDPDLKFKGKVIEIHDRAELRGEAGAAGGGNTVRMIVEVLDQDTLPPALRPGTGCSVKVRCGKRSVGYVLFHDAIAYVQRHIIFRFF